MSKKEAADPTELVRRCQSMALHPTVKAAGKLFRKAFKDAADTIESQARELAAAQAKIGELQNELVAEAKRFHSKQYCKCNWCQLGKKQEKKGGE